MEKKDIKSKVVTGIGWSYGQKMFSQLITLVVSVILARLLEPDHYGTIALVLVFISILEAFVSGGFGKALVQKENVSNQDFNTIAIFSIIISFFLYAIAFFSAPLIASLYSIPSLCLVIRVMGIKIILLSYNSIQHAYIEKNMEFKKLFYSSLVGTIISAITGISMAFAGAGIWALVTQYLLSALLDTIVLSVTLNWKIKIEFSYDSFKSMSKFGFRVLGATLVNTVQDNIRSLIVGKKFTTADLAYYNQGKKYPSYIMNNLIGSIQNVVFPAFSLEQRDKSKIKDFMRSSIRLSSFVVLPIVCGIIAVADVFVLALLTDKWESAIVFLRILSIIYLTRPLNSVFQSGLLAVGKSGVNLFHEIVGTISSLILVIVSAYIFKSVEMIAWSYSLVMAIGTTIFIIAVRNVFNYRLKEMVLDYVPFFLISALMGIIVFLIGRLNINKTVLLFIQIGIGVFTYIFLCWLLKVKELIIVSNYIKSKIKKAKEEQS